MIKDTIKLADIRLVMERIRKATPDSPVIVYGTRVEDRYRVAFGATVVSQEDIQRGSDRRGNNVIGLFDNTMPRNLARNTIQGGGNPWAT